MAESTIFSQLGFTENEVATYLLLLGQGRLTSHMIATRLRLPRSTTYSILDSLESRELVSRERARGTTFFSANNPQHLNDRLVEKKRALENETRLTSDLIASLMPIFKGGPTKAPRVEYYEGRAKVEQFLYTNMNLWLESMLMVDSTSWGFQDHTFVENYYDWITESFKSFHVEAGIKGRLLTNDAIIEKKLKGKIPRRAHRTLGTSIDFKSTIWINGHYVVQIMSRQKPNYCFQIQDPLLAENMRLIFTLLYEQAK